MSTNLSAVLYGIKDLRLSNTATPEPKEHEVLIKMGCVGICGSDVHYYVKGRCADYVVKKPMIIGHEASGTVYEVGSKVTHLKPGDRVAIEPGISCKNCIFCKKGRYNLCPEMHFCATPPVNGSLRQFYSHPADFCFKLPDHMTLEEGALLEPLSVGVRSCKRAGVTLGSTVLITGCGPIGLVTCAVAKAMGANTVLITGPHDHSLVMAKRIGADLALKVNKTENTQELSNSIITSLGKRPEITIDCVGTEASLSLGMEVTEWGGVLVVVGFAADIVTTALISALAREVDIRGVFRYANDYPAALSLVASRKVNVKQLITHNFDIEEAVEAFNTAHERKGDPIKVMIHCNK